ncbi:hypothetical protein NQ317_000449 [Molorchus minor]|uniref:Uncharacterized protein n=1 Tax=Molorchus minor TaxID=1323400 RepID=A0ABQ9JI00_9CUCU|nr:hypothetical protein NQ317_000449 [Molorchus minor]
MLDSAVTSLSLRISETVIRLNDDFVIGGWYILRDWSETNFDRNNILQQLHVRYGVSPFFKISVEPNPNIPGHNTIRISPSGLGLPDKKYYYMDNYKEVQAAYKQYIRDVVIYLSTAANDATKFGTDIFSYEQRIAEITPNTSSLLNPILTYNAISLSELKETSLLPFYDILQAMYPESNITENTEIIVSSLDYLGQITQIISSTDRKTLNGYLIWTLVRNYIPYLSNTYTSALDNFNAELYGTKKPLERWEMCSGLVRKFMWLAVNNYMEKANPVSEKTIKIANSTFDNIVNVVQDRIGKFEDTDLLYKHLKTKLSTLQLQLGVPSKARNESFLNMYYLELRIIRSNLFDSIKNGMNFQKRLEDKLLSNKSPEATIMSYILLDVPKVTYSPSDHAILIPRSLLTEPFFETNYPSSIIYGRLGVEIAEAISSSVLPYDSLWTADRKILSPFHMTVEESLWTVQSPMECLSDQISKGNLAIPGYMNNETSLKALVHLWGLSIANEALQVSLKEKEHVHQPSLESYEDNALFFVSYAQTQCSESTFQHQLYEEILNLELPQRGIVHLAWSQVSEFPASLECSVDKNAQCDDIF